VSDVAGAIPHFDDDDDDDDELTPAHAAASAQNRAMMEADCDKSSTGNPHQGSDYNADRVSEPLTAGQQAPSTGDHGVGAGRNPEIAAHHLDLRQSVVRYTPLGTLTTHNDPGNGDRGIIYPPGTVAVSRLDAAAAAGASGPLLPSGHPSMHGSDHIARNSATPQNGTHSLANPTSHAAPMAVKSQFELVREAMFGPR